MIKKRNRISLAVALFTATIPLTAQDLRKDTVRFALEEVTISAYRLNGSQPDASHALKIMTAREIAALPAHDIAGLLEYVPDLDVRQRGPLGVQSDISLRGGTFDQYALLINGINFNDPQTGHFQLDVPLPTSMIRRIELLSGADVRSLGSNALTGTINIVTGSPDSPRLHAGIMAGQHGYLETGIDGGSRQGAFWEQVGLSYSKSNGYISNTDFKNLNLFLQGGYKKERLEISLMAGGLKKAFGANSFYTVKYPNQFERTGTGFTALQAELKGHLNISESVYYRIHSDEFTLFRTNAPAWYKSPNYHLTQFYGSKTDFSFASAIGSTAISLEARREWIWSTVLGEVTGQTVPVGGSTGINYDHTGTRNHYSLSAGQQYTAGRFSLSGGLVLHRVTAKRNWFQAYPGIDIGFRPIQPVRTYLSFNRAFRLPTFTELYYQSPVNRGNPELLPETAWHGEAGGEFRTVGLFVRASLFCRYATQSIDWVRSAEETVWHTENLGRIVTTGMETSLAYSPVNPGLAKIVDRFELGFRRYFQHHETSGWYSQYILDYLKWKATFGVNIKAGKSFVAALRVIWQERNGTYTDFDDQQKPFEVDYKPFALADMKISYNLKWVTFIAECNNIFNVRYFDIGNVPQPGTWFKAGAEINLIGRN